GGVLVGEAGGLPADGDREQRWLRAYLCDPGLGGGRGRAAADLGGDFPGVVAEIARRGHGEHAADAADLVGVCVHGRAGGGGGGGDGEGQGAGGGGGEVAGDGVGDQAGALASGQRGGVDAGPADAGGGHGGKQQEQRGGGGGAAGAARYRAGERVPAAGAVCGRVHLAQPG